MSVNFSEKLCSEKVISTSCGKTNYNLSAYSESLMIFIEMKITIRELISYNWKNKINN
jgi:hypothetical protein